MRQPRLPGVTSDGQHDDLDELIDETYDATKAWKDAHAPMVQAKAKLLELMKAKRLTDYTSSGGIRAQLKRTEEKVTLKKTDDVIELDDDED